MLHGSVKHDKQDNSRDKVHDGLHRAPRSDRELVHKHIDSDMPAFGLHESEPAEYDQDHRQICDINIVGESPERCELSQDGVNGRHAHQKETSPHGHKTNLEVDLAYDSQKIFQSVYLPWNPAAGLARRG
jgi:hypothetical protein